jgi:hypothetical protein
MNIQIYPVSLLAFAGLIQPEFSWYFKIFQAPVFGLRYAGLPRSSSETSAVMKMGVADMAAIR